MTGAGRADDYLLHLDAVNAMSEDEFVAAFGDIAEHSPWVAANAAEARPFRTRTAMIAAFRAAVAGADHKRQKSLLLAHPDLAGRAAIACWNAAQASAWRSSRASMLPRVLWASAKFGLRRTALR